MDFDFKTNLAKLTTDQLKEKEIDLYTLKQKIEDQIKQLEVLIKKEDANKIQLRSSILNTNLLTSYLIEKEIITENEELTPIQIDEYGRTELANIDEKIKSLQDKIIQKKIDSKKCKDKMNIILQIYRQRQNPIDLEPSTINFDENEDKIEFPYYKKNDFVQLVIKDYLDKNYPSLSQSCKANFNRFEFCPSWNWTIQKAYDTTKKYYFRNYKQI